MGYCGSSTIIDLKMPWKINNDSDHDDSDCGYSYCMCVGPGPALWAFCDLSWCFWE